MNVFKVKIIFICFGLAITFGLIFTNSKFESWNQYKNLNSQLQEIRLNNALCNQETLKIRNQLFSNFDRLSKCSELINTLAESLSHQSPIFRTFTNADTKTLNENLTKKYALINKFKIANAAMKNSLVRMPMLVNELQNHVQLTFKTKPNIPDTDALLRDIYLYSLINDNKLDGEMTSNVQSINDWHGTGDPKTDNLVKLMFNHARLIIEKRRFVNDLTSSIVALPIDFLAERLQQHYLKSQTQELKQSGTYHALLFLICIMLIAYIGYILIKLKHNSDDLSEQRNRALVTLESIGDGVIATDINGVIEFLNPVAEQLTGWQSKNAKGKPIGDVYQIYDEISQQANTFELLQRIQHPDTYDSSQHTVLKNKLGKDIAIEESIAPIKNASGHFIGVIIVFHDVSKTRELSKELSFQAQHDTLTNALNRRAFEKRLTHIIDNKDKSKTRNIVLLYLDLDQFKLVNDTCGHIAGDHLLIQVTALIESKLGKHDVLARLGGDEFGILLGNSSIKQAEVFANMLLRAIKRYRFEWKSVYFQLGASIGVAATEGNETHFTQFLAAADMACYAAKDLGRNRVHVYNRMDKELIKRRGEMQWISKLNQAFKEDRFLLYKQPVVPLSDDQDINHYEVLVRLTSESGKITESNEFIAAAERYNFMPTLDRWVIRTLFKNSEYFKHNERFAINLSGTSLNSDSLLEYITQEFDHFSVDARKICFEITESAAIENLDNVTHLIQELKKLGFTFALDDFGKGLSSFSYLMKLPVDYLKIDGEFVKNMLSNNVYAAIINYTNRIGHLMGLKTIAECVENQEILNMLYDMSVDYAQGYKIGKPVLLTIDKNKHENKQNVLQSTIA